jgi:hypothetical protein
MFATIDGVCQKPVELTKTQTQHFWLADDREGYKVALAAQLFHDKLCINHEEKQPVEQHQEHTHDGNSVAEDDSAPKRSMHF